MPPCPTALSSLNQSKWTLNLIQDYNQKWNISETSSFKSGCKAEIYVGLADIHTKFCSSLQKKKKKRPWNFSRAFIPGTRRLGHYPPCCHLFHFVIALTPAWIHYFKNTITQYFQYVLSSVPSNLCGHLSSLTSSKSVPS